MTTARTSNPVKDAPTTDAAAPGAVASRLQSALAHVQTDARRLFHGRGQQFPGLEHICIDWYPPVLLVTAYQPIACLDAIIAAARLADVHHQVKSIIHQRRYETGAPADCAWGEPMDTCIVNEGDLKFEVHPGQQQNAGLFLDMRLLREWLVANTDGKQVLNRFADTCALSVAAMAGGARGVVNVDMSKTSIRWGEENHALNGQDPRRIKSLPHNIFKSWGRIKQFGRYDLIIIDPPARQRGSFDAEKNYGAILKKLGQMIVPGGEVIATINSPYLGPDFLEGQFARWAPDFRLLSQMPVAPEFTDAFPERGLNILHYRHNGKRR